MPRRGGFLDVAVVHFGLVFPLLRADLRAYAAPDVEVRYLLTPSPASAPWRRTFDGATWKTILPEGHKQFEPAYYQPLISLDGRLWLFNGYDPDTDLEIARALFSDDNGVTWASFAGGAGGPEASHADTLVTAGDRILRVSGNLSERAIWSFQPVR